MADNSKIEWTESTWNPIAGCNKVSPGCKNCYAIRDAHRMAGNPNEKIAKVYRGLTVVDGGSPNWTGLVRFVEERLDQPLRWKRPRMIFVNSQSDLFHEDLPIEIIAKIFAVMASTPEHTYQVLTKRAERMYEIMTREEFVESVWKEAGAFTHAYDGEWPLPNVWMGISCEDQKRYDERKNFIYHTPAAVRWLSLEPLLGDIDLGMSGIKGSLFGDTPDWVVAGGESGSNARPMNPQWARKLRDQCVAANVPFFFKQFGQWAWSGNFVGELYREYQRYIFEDKTVMLNTGKKAAGRLLDGREWNQMPEPR